MTDLREPDLCIDCGAELHPTHGMLLSVCPDCNERRLDDDACFIPDLPGHGPSHEEYEP